MFSSSHLQASNGRIPQLVGQVERHSTKDTPFPYAWFLNALRTACLALMMYLGCVKATRSM